MKEEKCIVLDFLPNGYPDRRHPEPIAQAIGRNFTLLELAPKEEINLKPEEEVYVGEGTRDKIRTVKGVLDPGKLTNYSRNLLREIVERIVKEDEQKFVYFFNSAGTITPRMHKLELLPGIGKKHVQDILAERKKKPFENFGDIDKRVKLYPGALTAVVKRILEELHGSEKYQIFVPMKGRRTRERRY